MHDNTLVPYAPPPFPSAAIEPPPPPRPRRRWLKRIGLVTAGAVVATVPLALVLNNTMGERDELEVDLADTEDELDDTENELDDTEATLADTEEDLAFVQDNLSETTAELSRTEADLADARSQVSAQGGALDSCYQVALMLEDAINEHIQATDAMFDAVSAGITLNNYGLDRALDTMQSHRDEADRIYNDASALFQDCIYQ